MDSINKMLEEREPKYGCFRHRAYVACKLIECLEEAKSECVFDEWMEPVQEHAIRMILEKISRAICGNAGIEDTWEDIAGYAMQARNGGVLADPKDIANIVTSTGHADAIKVTRDDRRYLAHV